MNLIVVDIRVVIIMSIFIFLIKKLFYLNVGRKKNIYFEIIFFREVIFVFNFKFEFLIILIMI